MWYVQYESEALVEEENPERVKCSDDETLQTWDWTWKASLKGSPEASGYHKDKNLHTLNKKSEMLFIPRRMNQKPWWAWSNRQLISIPPAELIVRGFAVQSQMNFLSSRVRDRSADTTDRQPPCLPTGRVVESRRNSDSGVTRSSIFVTGWHRLVMWWQPEH